jgi:hypothetical protein
MGLATLPHRVLALRCLLRPPWWLQIGERLQPGSGPAFCSGAWPCVGSPAQTEVDGAKGKGVVGLQRSCAGRVVRRHCCRWCLPSSAFDATTKVSHTSACSLTPSAIAKPIAAINRPTTESMKRGMPALCFFGLNRRRCVAGARRVFRRRHQRPVRRRLRDPGHLTLNRPQWKQDPVQFRTASLQLE